MAKRSPILGYNHNVRYRGLIFHVQTEDSGVLSPHLFTHLFHEGVIVSTRKLVYDAGASEEAIKSLMQAQHKAVLKELKTRTFDDKIDLYLGNSPGLEPRGRASEPIADPAEVSSPKIDVEAAPVAVNVPEPTPPSIEIVRDDVLAAAPTRQLDEDTREVLAREAANEAVREAAARVAAAQEAARGTVEPVMPAVPAVPPARTTTAERTSRSSQFRSMSPPPPDGVPIEVNGGPTIPTPAPPHRPTPPTAVRPTRPVTPPPIPSRASKPAITFNVDSSPEIEIIPSDDDSGHSRTTRDTDINEMLDHGVPTAVGDDRTRPSDGVPTRAGSDSAAPQTRPPSHGAATLPAMRQPSRPSITPAQVVSRPLPPEQRNHDNTDAIEVYAPAPPSVEPPPGERATSERSASGKYSMTRRPSEAVPSSRVAVPAGLGRPRNAASPAVGSPAVPRPEARNKQPSGAVPIVADPKSTRVPPVTAVIASRSPATGSPNNVVMTRPAVIVGAPAKPPGTPVPPRVRKAREDEGRGFGQGLISEKSLDEVILAYLSEDAEES